MSGRATESRAPGVEPALLSDDQAAVLYGISVRKFHEQRQTEAYIPAPVVLGPRCLRWVRDELIASIAMMPRQTLPAAEPLQLLKARAKRAGTTEVKT